MLQQRKLDSRSLLLFCGRHHSMVTVSPSRSVLAATPSLPNSRNNAYTLYRATSTLEPSPRDYLPSLGYPQKGRSPTGHPFATLHIFVAPIALSHSGGLWSSHQSPAQDSFSQLSLPTTTKSGDSSRTHPIFSPPTVTLQVQ